MDSDQARSILISNDGPPFDFFGKHKNIPKKNIGHGQKVADWGDQAAYQEPLYRLVIGRLAIAQGERRTLKEPERRDAVSITRITPHALPCVAQAKLPYAVERTCRSSFAMKRFLLRHLDRGSPVEGQFLLRSETPKSVCVVVLGAEVTSPGERKPICVTCVGRTHRGTWRNAARLRRFHRPQWVGLTR